MWELIDSGKRLVQSVIARDVAASLRNAGSVLENLADAYDFLTGKTPVPVMSAGEVGAADAELAALLGDLEECQKAPVMAGADADPKALDPASILLIIQAVTALLKFIRERRQKPAA